MKLPNDPVMLASVLNVKLRDYYSSLSSLCDDLELSEEELLDRLAASGLRYDDTANRVERN